MEISIEQVVKDLNEVDFIENLDVIFKGFNDFSYKINRLEVEMVDKLIILKEDKILFMKLVEDMLDQLINLMNLYKIVINEYGKIKYLEPEKELKYEKIQSNFDKVKEIFNDIDGINNSFIKKMSDTDEKLSQVSNSLNIAVRNFI